MPQQLKATGTLGTAAVFLAAISTILGAILFLRFGYAVAHVGFLGALAIILIGLIGHAVTIPTAMALAEIATNQKVEGGGEYSIVSRPLGSIPAVFCLAGRYHQSAVERCPAGAGFPPAARQPAHLFSIINQHIGFHFLLRTKLWWPVRCFGGCLAGC